MSEQFFRDLARDLVEAFAPDWEPSEKGAVMRKMVKVLQERLTIYGVDIQDFHQKFGLEYVGPPRFLPPDVHEFRLKFMKEELNEYDEAYHARNMHDQFDALIDLAYVLFGTNHLHGFPFAAGWRLVHSANMAKVRAERAEDSKRGSKFDVVKPPGWVAPDLTPLLPKPEAEPTLFSME